MTAARARSNCAADRTKTPTSCGTTPVFARSLIQSATNRGFLALALQRAHQGRRTVEDGNCVAPVLGVAVHVGDRRGQADGPPACGFGATSDNLRAMYVNVREYPRRAPSTRTAAGRCAARDRPAKKRALRRPPPKAAKNRTCATVMSCASSTTAKSKTGFLALARSRPPASVNSCASVIISRAFKPSRTRSKIDHKTFRCGSGMRVFLPKPRNIAIGFPVLQLPGVDHLLPFRHQKVQAELVAANVGGGLLQQIANHVAAGDGRRADVGLVEPQPNGVQRMNVDPLGETRFACQQPPELRLQGIGERVGESRQQDAGVGIRSAPETPPDAGRRWSCPCPPIRTPAPAPRSLVRPTGAGRDGGRPSTSPTGSRERAPAPPHSPSRGTGAARPDARTDFRSLRRAAARAACRRWPAPAAPPRPRPADGPPKRASVSSVAF